MHSLTQAIDLALQLIFSADPLLLAVVLRSLAVTEMNFPSRHALSPRAALLTQIA